MIDLPAFVALDAAVVAGGFSLLALGISRSPGWRAYRWLALALFGAFGLSLCYALMSLPVPDWLVASGPRGTMLFAAIHAAGQLRLIAELERRELPRLDRLLLALLAVSAAAALVPGVTHLSIVAVRTVPWAGLVYRFAEPGPGAPVVFGTLIIAHALVAFRGLTARALGATARRALGVALLAAVGFGVNDALTALELWASPYLLAVPVFALATVAGLLLVFHFLAQSIHAEVLARDLGDEVRARTEELERTVVALAAAERQVALGRLAADVSTALRPSVQTLAREFDGAPGPAADAALQRITGSVRGLQQATAALQRDPRRRPALPLLSLVREELTRVRRTRGQALSTQIELDASLAADVDGDLAGPLVASLLDETISRLPTAGPQLLTVRGRREGARIELDVAGDATEPLASLEAALRGDEPPRGAGLPLPIARAIARLDGAELRAERDPVLGARLRLYLRAATG